MIIVQTAILGIGLEKCVMRSIAGRPEEEWILDNNNNESNNNNNSHRSRPMLLAGVDRSKDQSYFLSGVKSEAFHNVIFPLGHLSKSQNQQHKQQLSVRDIAKQVNIPTATKRDSMGICFIGKRNFTNFMSQYISEPSMPGNFVDVDTGEIVGRHNGAIYYTIGQGAKISGAVVRYFVCGKGGDGSGGGNVTSNDDDLEATVFVCNNTHHPALYTDELYVDFDSFNWIGLGGGGGGGESSSNTSVDHYEYQYIPRPLVEGKSIKLLARTRHLQPLASCTVMWNRNRVQQLDTCSSRMSSSRGHLVVKFDKP